MYVHTYIHTYIHTYRNICTYTRDVFQIQILVKVFLKVLKVSIGLRHADYHAKEKKIFEVLFCYMKYLHANTNTSYFKTLKHKYKYSK